MGVLRIEKAIVLDRGILMKSNDVQGLEKELLQILTDSSIENKAEALQVLTAKIQQQGKRNGVPSAEVESVDLLPKD